MATLPMYDFPELRGATDALWHFVASKLRQQGIDAPVSLLRTAALADIWANPALLLGQTCGYPLVTLLKGRADLLATPCYNAPGCDGPNYRSAFIVRTDAQASSLADMRGRRCAANDMTSNSGMNVLRASVASLARDQGPFFGQVVLTGSHLASVQSVAEGCADIAAIDCVTWAHVQHLRPVETRNLRVLTWSDPTPGLPLITSVQTSVSTRRALLKALALAVLEPAMLPVLAALRIVRFAAVPLAAYEDILVLERRAAMAGYPCLC